MADTGQADQPGQNIDAIFQTLANELANVSSALGAQGIAQIVSNFDGNPKQFTNWIKDIDKYAKITNLNDTRKKLVAFQTSKGAVSGFIQRYTAANPQCTFDQLKQELAKRFSDVADQEQALSMLRQVKQKAGENIQVYAERLLLLAEEAYNNAGNPAVERQLTEIFVDGLRDDHLKLKLMRDRPNTLQGAIGIATNEQNLRRRVLMTGHRNSYFQNSHEHVFRAEQGNANPATSFEPMEVDHLRKRKCFKCHKYGHTSRDCRADRSVFAVQRTQQGINQDRDKTGRILECWNCGKRGHIQRFCRASRTVVKTEN